MWPSHPTSEQGTSDNSSGIHQDNAKTLPTAHPQGLYERNRPMMTLTLKARELWIFWDIFRHLQDMLSSPPRWSNKRYDFGKCLWLTGSKHSLGIRSLGWRALKTPTSATPVLAVTWPRSRFNTSGPDPLGFDWEDLAASRGTAGGHSGRPPIK